MPDEYLYDHEDLKRRALVAYLQTNTTTDLFPGLKPWTSDVVEHDGLLYVVISNSVGPRAVYRVLPRGEKGMLRRLKRPPRALVPQWYADT